MDNYRRTKDKCTDADFKAYRVWLEKNLEECKSSISCDAHIKNKSFADPESFLSQDCYTALGFLKGKSLALEEYCFSVREVL